MHTKIRDEFTEDGIKHQSNNYYYKSSWVKYSSLYTLHGFRSSLLSGMLPFRHDSPPSTGEKELVQPWSKPAWLHSKRWQTGWDEGEHSTLPAAPATFLARWGWGTKEGLSLLPSIRLWFSWQLPGAYSAALDWARELKGQFLLRTNVDQGCIHKLGGYTEQNHWKIIWTILLGISPHTVSWLIPCQLHNKRKQGRA